MTLSRRAQVAIEFIFMLGMALILMIAFLAVISTVLEEENRKAKEELFTDLGLYVQRELVFAESREQGYERTFIVPPDGQNDTFASHPYTMAIQERTLVITTSDQTYTFPIPNITGQILIGNNTIYHENDTLILNP